MGAIVRGSVHTPDGGGGGGASGTIGAAFPAIAAPLAGKDPSNNLKELHTAADGTLLVSVSGAGSGGASSVDNSGYAAGTTAGTALMGAVDDVGTTAAIENDVAIARITTQRALHTNLRTAAGVETGIAAAPLQVSLANHGANATPVAVTLPSAGTSTLSNVASSASNVTVLAANAARLGGMLYNDSTSNVFIKFGATASATSFTEQLLPQGSFDITKHKYTGKIDAIWVSANGNMRVTELTA